MNLYKAKFPSRIFTKAIYPIESRTDSVQSKYKNLCSIKPDIKEICKQVKQSQSADHLLQFWKI